MCLKSTRAYLYLLFDEKTGILHGQSWIGSFGCTTVSFFWWCHMMGSNSESATGRLTMGHVFFSFSYHINSVFIQWITVNTRTKQVYWDCLQIIFQLYSMGIMPLHVRALMINQPEWRFTWWYQFIRLSMIYGGLTSTKRDGTDVNCPGSDCWGTRIPHLAGFGESQKLFSETSHRIHVMVYVYIPTFTMKMNQREVNIPYVDGMGLESVAHKLCGMSESLFCGKVWH